MSYNKYGMIVCLDQVWGQHSVPGYCREALDRNYNPANLPSLAYSVEWNWPEREIVLWNEHKKDGNEIGFSCEAVWPKGL